MPALRFSLFGVPVEVRAAFLLLVVLIGLPGHLSAQGMLGWVAIATLAVFAHEAGHALAFLAYGEKPSITLHGAGGVTIGGHVGVRRMIVVSAAGPLAGLLLGLLVLVAARYLPHDPQTQALVGDALFATFGLSLANLLPLGTMDGASMLNGAVSAALGRPAGVIGWVAGALSVALVFGIALVSGHLAIAIFLVFIVAFMAFETRSIVDPFGRPEQHRSADSLLLRGRAVDALARAEADMRARPDDAQLALVAGAALFSLTRWNEAEAIYSAVLEKLPGNQHALAYRSAARRALGRHAEADEDLASLLSEPPADVNDVGAQFLGLYSAHRYTEALALIRSELAQGDGRGPEAHHLLGLEAVLLAVLGEAEAAVRQADALAAVRPDQFGIHELLALALIQLGRLEQARDRMRRALAGAPSHPELLETMGIVKRLAGDPERAFVHLLESATARPDLPRARAELSACFTQLGRHAEAAAGLDSLPAWSADDPFVLYARACALTAAGQTAEAAERLERAAAVRPSLGRVARVDPLLQALFAGAAAPLPAPTPAALPAVPGG